MSNNFKLNFDSSDDESAVKTKKISFRSTYSDEEEDDNEFYEKKRNAKNIFDDDDEKKKPSPPKSSLKSKIAPSANNDIRAQTAPTLLSNTNDDDKLKQDTLLANPDKYSKLIIKGYMNEEKTKENLRTSSIGSVELNKSGISSYSKSPTSVPPPPQIGALRYNPAKLLEDSVRKSSTSINYPITNSSAKDKKSDSLNDDLNINYTSDIANKTLVKENIELKSKISKLTAELNSTQLKMNDKPDCKDTISRFLLNRPYSFDIYKTKREKLQLLNEATNTHDGNVIFAVVNYLKNSLSTDVFNGILIKNPVALNQYVFYLDQMNCHSDLAEFYKFQGSSNESASIKYFKPILCNKNQDLNEKIQIIREFENKSNQSEQNLVNNGMVIGPVKKQLALFSIQKEILKNKSTFLRKDESKQNAMDHLNGSSLANTVSFCLKYNKELNDNASYSIENLKKEFDIQTKQFAVWFIKAMSEIGSWTELENFTKQRGIFNMVKSPPVSFETIVFMISKVKGPQEQIKKYINLIENIERRKSLAIRFKITDTVIDTYKIQKDRVGLLNYRNTFREGSNDYIKANIVLADNQVKWKN